MVNLSRSRRHVRLLLVSFLLMLSYSSTANVVLNPGLLVGSVGLDGWTFTSSNVYLSGNALGYSASSSFEGTSFMLTATGDQTYGRLELTRSFPGGSFNLISSTPYLIPADSRLEVDLRRPGGTLVSLIHLTGGQLLRSQHNASSQDTLLKEEYEVNVHVSGAGDAQVPMVAGEAINLEVLRSVPSPFP
jgi:hypothetical protein